MSDAKAQSAINAVLASSLESHSDIYDDVNNALVGHPWSLKPSAYLAPDTSGLILDLMRHSIFIFIHLVEEERKFLHDLEGDLEETEEREV